MRDRDDGAAGREALERTLNLLFRFGIERGRGFVQEKDGRVLEQCARDGEALLLATGEQTTLIANLRFVTLGLGYDKIVRKRSLQKEADAFIKKTLDRVPATVPAVKEYMRSAPRMEPRGEALRNSPAGSLPTSKASLLTGSDESCPRY